jgi:hypothetical protein
VKQAGKSLNKLLNAELAEMMIQMSRDQHSQIVAFDITEGRMRLEHSLGVARSDTVYGGAQ